jgi:hypothetical protein
MLQCIGLEGKSRQTAKISTAFYAVCIRAGPAQFNRTVTVQSLLFIGKVVFNDEGDTVQLSDTAILWVISTLRGINNLLTTTATTQSTVKVVMKTGNRTTFIPNLCTKLRSA